jgi:hypothetical protein
VVVARPLFLVNELLAGMFVVGCRWHVFWVIVVLAEGGEVGEVMGVFAPEGERDPEINSG